MNRTQRNSLAIFATTFMIVTLLASSYSYSVYAAGNGNPKPGFPKDTLIFHIQKEQSSGFSNNCNGGHSVHIGAIADADGNLHPLPTNIGITMKDWVQIDNDNDGLFDEDPIDGIDNDLDGLIDEDPVEPNNKTFATDCDSRAPGDDEVSFQIGDKDPDKGQISAQSWFMRLQGAPQQNFIFDTSGEHSYKCTLVDDVNGIVGDGDDIIECDTDIIELDHVNVKEDCSLSFKEGGKNKQGGGKTEFCDITDTFLVDYDNDGDGLVNEDDELGFDGMDNDGDGLIDEDGPDGEHIFAFTCEATFGVQTDEDPLDGFDNDGDGLNGEDPIDGIDNDGDGLFDEDPFEPVGTDNDMDGLIDEDPIDGIDNDGDGLVDEDPIDGSGPNVDQDQDGVDGEDPIDGIDNDGDETGEFCPLGKALWDVDSKSGKPLIQVFVIHDEMDVNIKQHGKGLKDHKGKFDP